MVKRFLRIIKEKGTIVLPDEKEGIYFIIEAWYLVRAYTILIVGNIVTSFLKIVSEKIILCSLK